MARRHYSAARQHERICMQLGNKNGLLQSCINISHNHNNQSKNMEPTAFHTAFHIVAKDLKATSDGRIFTNTGAIIKLRSLFCEAMDLLRVQNFSQYEKIIYYLKPRSTMWTREKDVHIKNNLRAGGRSFDFIWQAKNKSMSCHIEDENYLLNEVQSANSREINIILPNKNIPETMIQSLNGQSISNIVNINSYFTMIRGAIIKDAANLEGSVHLTLEK